MVMMDLPSARRQKKVLEIKIQPVPLEPPPPLLRSPPAPGRRLLAGQAQSPIPPRNRNIPPICLGGWCVVPLDSIQLFKRYRRRRERERTTTTVTTIAITTTATCYSYSSHYSYYVLCTVTTHLHPPTTVGACHVVLQYPTYRSPPLRLPPTPLLLPLLPLLPPLLPPPPPPPPILLPISSSSPIEPID